MKDILIKYMDKYTTLSEEQKLAIVNEIQIREVKKGTILLQQGDIPTKCYFVLQGCIRQYSLDEAGKEVTSNFYTEEQAITSFQHHKQDKASSYTFVCLEDCIVVVGDLIVEEQMYNKYTQLAIMTRKMIEHNFGEMQDELATFIALSPEERYKAFIKKRPSLINRVPQHQLASYLGITPESLSRIKKRLNNHF